MWCYCLIQSPLDLMVLKLVLHDAIFLAPCHATLEIEIHCKLQETCSTLHSRAATCNSFKKNLQSLHKVEPSTTDSVTRGKFLCIFCCKYAISKINMLCNLCCLKTRLRLLCNKYQRHSSVNLVLQQLKLCNIFIFGMAYWRCETSCK